MSITIILAWLMDNLMVYLCAGKINSLFSFALRYSTRSLNYMHARYPGTS